MSRKLSPVSPLALYNLISAGLWGYLLYKVVAVYPKMGQPAFFYETRSVLNAIQCGALIEIFNSLLGIVRAPLLTTVAQVASRLLLTVGIFQYLPESYNAHNYTFVALLLAWSVTEIVRYSFYYCNLTISAGAPKFLILLRYNLFWILYPMGVASELLIIYSALPVAEAKYSAHAKLALIVGMLTYIPGFPMLFSHMVVQRKKVMKSLFSNSKKQN
ncbi:LANO_0D08526g1_1 [Lachancea nothofagi CBS 11611]|uniref:Very-long-chain (3R)-3-hydroxyacyl-CoA dehydratase n=1 Tax=Lachancea nothofagi CBS 11611 TaxID=1266666 RepID=A0A1G4JJ84_9SACH|nr:LANO_0D08526g1_1 [Lachancea nothofagi CBS 11611]